MADYTVELSGGRRPLSLGRKLGEGAAGIVFTLPQMRGHAAKIYKSRQEADAYREKIAVMLATRPHLPDIRATNRLCRQIAWPHALIHDAAGAFSGFVMPEIDFAHSHPLESILQRNSRRADRIDERYELRVVLATNMASVFAELHRLGHFMIDMKPDNLRFYADAGYLAVVDTDGFSIRGASRRFPSHQFTDNYIAPEGRGRSPENMDVGQDQFALAVILFQLLNNGLHPYGGVVKRGRGLPSDLQSRVYANLYAYGLRPHADIAPAPTSMHEYFDDRTRQLFDRAFLGGGGRPTAREWRDHLRSLLKDQQLFVCHVNPREHAHFGRGCGLCAYEKKLQAAASAARATQSGAQRKPTQIRVSPRPPTPPPRPPSPPLSSWPVAAPPPAKAHSHWPWLALAAVLVLLLIASLPTQPRIENGTSGSSTTGDTTDLGAGPGYSVSRFGTPVDYVVVPGEGALAAKLRSGPARPQIARLPAGERVTGHGRAYADGESWIEVSRSDGTRGFVAERLLRPAGEMLPVAEWPSFSCTAAAGWDERTICEHSDLAARDREMVGLYRDLLAAVSPTDELEAGQREWLRSRRQCEDSFDGLACLRNLYQSRIDALRAWAPSAPPPPRTVRRSPTSPTLREDAPYYVPPPRRPADAATPVFEPVPARLEVPVRRIVRDDDYPAEAARRGESGAVTVRVAVSAGGQVVDCTVTGTSGSAALDRTTCNLFRRRARYSPAIGSDGKPVADMVQHRVLWRLSD